MVAIDMTSDDRKEDVEMSGDTEVKKKLKKEKKKKVKKEKKAKKESKKKKKKSKATSDTIDAEKEVEPESDNIQNDNVGEGSMNDLGEIATVQSVDEDATMDEAADKTHEEYEKEGEEAYPDDGGYNNDYGYDKNDTCENINERKIFLSRIPTTFDEEAVRRALGNLLGPAAIEHVALSTPKIEEDANAQQDGERSNKKEKDSSSTEHKGFAFITLSSIQKKEEALKNETMKCKAKPTSKRKYTLYIRPVVSSDHDENGDMAKDDYNTLNACFLWRKFRCPYGDECKFQHIGEGGCIEIKEETKVTDKRCKQKCFVYKMKGRCKLGDACPYRHDFEPKCKPVPVTDATNTTTQKKSKDKDKDCFNWKTKGKCRKGDKCPYKHCDLVREALLAKKNKSAEQNSGNKRSRQDPGSNSSNPQPLSVRVFGLNYDTKEEDVRKYFEHCGQIKEITFPKYEDSGRSKGYCGVLFTSPKATEKACELDGLEWNGRWLSVQKGKMYLKQWEEREKSNLKTKEKNDEPQIIGEFGQKVKRRKKHGFREDV